MAAAARGPPAASSHASSTHSRRPLLTTHVCRGAYYRIVCTDEERIDVDGTVLFGSQATVPTVSSGRAGARAQARGDAPRACLSERPRARMGSRAAETAQPLRARAGAGAFGRTRGSMLAGDGHGLADSADAPRTVVHGPIHHPYAYGWALVHTM